MRVAVVIDVDDQLLAGYVDELWDEEPRGEPKPTPQEFLARRILELANDELQVALWGWADKLGMTVSVEAPDA